jgi:hypothetical protein
MTTSTATRTAEYMKPQATDYPTGSLRFDWA